MTTNRHRLDHRLVLLAPTPKDATLTQSLLGQAEIECDICNNLDEVLAELDAGAGALLLAEEVIAQEGASRLTAWFARQPRWSDLHVLLLSRAGADSPVVGQAMDLFGNVTVLERPTRIATLVSVVRTALRARQRQYQIRDHLDERERSFAAQEQLAAIVTSSDDAIISKNLEGDVLTWNAGAERLFGYTADEMIGRPITAVIPLDRRSEEASIVERLRRGEHVEHFETVRMAKDGRNIEVSLTVSPIRDSSGNVIGASKVARDISAQKHSEMLLRNSETKTRRLLELNQITTASMAEGMYTVDGDDLLTYMNPEAERLFGWKCDELLGRRMHEVTHYMRPDGSSFPVEECPAYAVLHHGEVLKGCEDQFIRKDGTFFPVSYSSSPLRDPDGKVVGLVVVFQDITERKRAEMALQEAHRRKEEFLAVLAHELRNPLAPLRHSLQILRLTSADDPSVNRLSEIMERQVDHLVRLVDDLMEISRISRGLVELRPEPVELVTFLRSAVEISKPLIEAAGHQFSLSVPPETLTVYGDPVRLTQIIANLLNNAAKYTERGGQISLSVRHDREKNDVTIAIRDTGIGIAPEMLERVFDLFTQVDRQNSRGQGGLGIGLTLVKSLVELHHGTIEARSAGLGQGSEFIVRLPLARKPNETRPEKSADPSSLSVARRVLVVDDNQDAARSLGQLLRLLGAEVHVVFSGPEALETVAKFRPDVVLLDIGMPGMDGHEVARRIRQNPDAAGVTLIALTGWGQERDRVISHDAGFDHHLVKPADIAVLKTLLVSLDS